MEFYPDAPNYLDDLLDREVASTKVPYLNRAIPSSFFRVLAKIGA
jgi:hypothetical protein